MTAFQQLAVASLLGLATTSSSLLGAAVGLYIPFSKRPLACLLGFAAGALISALAIELAYESALSLHHRGYDAHAAWAFVSAGFAEPCVGKMDPSHCETHHQHSLFCPVEFWRSVILFLLHPTH